jgi:tetratricopeptide (TPR) repeat protein
LYLFGERPAEAIPLIELNLALYEAKFGADYPDALTARDDLALAYRGVGRLDDATRLHEQTLKQKESKLGIDHPETLYSRHNLASAYLSASRTDDAIRLYEPNLKLGEARLGAEHPYTLIFRDKLAMAYLFADRIADAIRLHEQNLKLRETKLGTGHLQTLQSRDNLANAYNRAGEFAKAEPLLRDCLMVREAKHPNTWEKFHTRSLLGESLLGQKRYADAEPLLLSGYQGMKERERITSPEDKLRVREARERLVRLYEAIGDKDKAAKWRNEPEAPAKPAKKEQGGV